MSSKPPNQNNDYKRGMMPMLTRRETFLGAAIAAGSIPTFLRGQSISSTNASLRFVNPELRPAAEQLLAMIATLPPYSLQSLQTLRATGSKWAKPPLSSIPWEKRMVPGKAGNPDVSIYLINARPGRQRGAIVYMHGGGFVSGSAFLEIDRAQRLAAELDCLIVSVEYRLAPETRVEGAVEDNYAALLWLYKHADQLGADRSRVAVLGESAGGGHAALLAITARDRGEVPLAFQCLVYPMLDDRTGNTRTVPAPIGTLGWDAKANAFGWQSFLGRRPGGADRSGVPGREPNLTNLPPAWIGVGSIDLFVQEDVSFAERLITSAVPVELNVVPGAFHGFDLIGEGTTVAKRFTASKTEALRRAITG